MSFKTIAFFLSLTFLTSSCLAVKFPSEIKVSLDIPANLSDENVSKLIDKIPEKIGKKDVKVFVAVPNKKSPKVIEERSESTQYKTQRLQE